MTGARASLYFTLDFINCLWCLIKKKSTHSYIRYIRDAFINALYGDITKYNDRNKKSHTHATNQNLVQQSINMSIEQKTKRYEVTVE